MRLYSSSPAYLTAMMAEGAQRIDLAGNIVEPGKQLHAGFAKFRLTLEMLGIKPSTFYRGMTGSDPAGQKPSKTSRRSLTGS
jgi:hypothetical protein